MIVDDDVVIRERALLLILNARREESSGTIRKFVKPTLNHINLNAEKYHQILKWDSINVTSPPILSKYSENDLKAFVEDPSPLKLKLKFPCHSQKVEFFIQEITRVAKKYPKEERDDILRITAENRDQHPNFRSKKNIFMNNNKENRT